MATKQLFTNNADQCKLVHRVLAHTAPVTCRKIMCYTMVTSLLIASPAYLRHLMLLRLDRFQLPLADGANDFSRVSQTT